MRVDRRASAWKGLLGGALGGLVASFVMGQFYALVTPKADLVSDERKEDSTVLAASAISRHVFHHELTPEQKKFAGPVVHYSFGASMAAVYGALAEFAPWVRAGWGLGFGAAVWLGAHVIVVPALHLSEPITKSTPGSEAAEFGAHLVYGAVVEGVRRLVRGNGSRARQ